MRRVPQTNVTELILLGFSDYSFASQAVLFTFFLSTYVLTLLGNGLIVLSVTLDRGLHSPMYFFLRNLSFLEVFSTTVTVPKVLKDFLSERKSISFSGCATQMFAFFAIGVSECIFLAVMALDRYVAICQPLRYTSLMSGKMCCLLTVLSWTVGFLVSLGNTYFIFRLPFCDSYIVNHFFCDVPSVLNLVCANTFSNELFIFISCLVGATIPFLLIFGSYINILSSITLIRSADGRQKALSTCGSHLMSVVLFYGSAMFVHLRLNSRSTIDTDRMTALFYCVIIPIINPLIYSLRNKDMKRALWKVVLRRNISQHR